MFNGKSAIIAAISWPEHEMMGIIPALH